MKRVFQTTDAQVFESPREARKHQVKINAQNAIRDFFDTHGYGGMDRQDAAGMVIERAAQLFEPLSALVR